MPETIVDCVAQCKFNQAGSIVSPRRPMRSREEWRFLPGSSNLHRIAAMHGFGTRAHSSAKIAALVALLGSCTLDVHEGTSESACMNVTRMGISTQSLDVILTDVHIITRGCK